jgi:hypothetical protein
MSKRNSKALSEWIKTAQELGYNKVVVDPNTGKKKIVNMVSKKNPAAYAAVRKAFDEKKKKGY